MNKTLKKRTVFILLPLFLSLALSAQDRFTNYPLPSEKDTLRILAIGNSFSDDGTDYLPGLLEAADIHNVIIARLYIGGCSLERHCTEYSQNLTNYIYYKSTENKWVTISRNAGLRDALKDEAWDIITIQEASGYSGTYENYEKWIPELISIIRKEAANPSAAIVWHQTWAYAVNSTHSHFKFYGNDQHQMYSSICQCVEKASEEFQLSIVIPCGDAIQAARGTKLNNIGEVPSDNKVYDLTRDGYHLTHQYGRYIAACTWFEALIRPVYGKTVLGNPYTLRDTEYSITKKDAILCQKCAVQAVKGRKTGNSKK